MVRSDTGCARLTDPAVSSGTVCSSMWQFTTSASVPSETSCCTLSWSTSDVNASACVVGTTRKSMDTLRDRAKLISFAPSSS
uniref:Uncharacterized protein n=1 Tax=Arundo donax TaxID=35708 RepID=A0A0A9F2S0_ARUDO